MVNTFLYIDDAKEVDIQSIANGLNASGIVKVIPEPPSPWEEQLSQIVSRISQIDGLLFDWRITEEAPRPVRPEEKPFIYTAEALAQQIRVNYSDKEKKVLVKDIPIILCSGEKNFKAYSGREATWQDLFDVVYEKDDFKKQHQTVVSQLNSLAEAYKILQTGKPTWHSILSLSKEAELDTRLVNSLSTLIENKVPHIFVRFLLNEVIKTPGILIDEYILAARLGIDKDGSSDWQSLLDKVINPKMKYSGLLSAGWSRWWADGLVQWWKSEISPQHPQLLGAGQRVALLKKQTGLENLVSAKQMKFCASDEFWTVCVATKRPIDIADGLRILSDNPYAWQDEQFISLFALLDRTTPKTFKLSPLEKERFDYLKKIAKGNG
jgi:hypothetical protein